MLNTKGLKFGKAVKAFSGKDPNRVPGNVQGLQIGHPMPTMSRQMNKLKLNRKKIIDSWAEKKNSIFKEICSKWARVFDSSQLPSPSLLVTLEGLARENELSAAKEIHCSFG